MPSYTAIIADPASARPAVECQETRWLARWKQRGQQPGGWPAWAVITGIAICMFGLRLAGPANLVSQDQERPAAYVLDVTKNGHWLCQRDLDGGITSKPPVWTWLSAVASLAWGRIGEFTLYLPGALAALGTAWLVYGAGKRFFGVRAGFMAAVAVLLTTAGYKQFGLARTDGVFTFTIAVSALLGFRAWQLRHGWIWFWMMSAVATLTKGPLGLILAAGGLLASGWEGAIHELKPVRGGHLSGIALFLLLTVGWLALSTWQLGSQVTDKLIREELLPQAIGKSDGHYPGTLLWQPCLYYLGRAAPWSVLTYFGLWQVWKSRKVPNNPWIQAVGDTYGGESIRFTRFVSCWFAFGLLLFSLAPHQRGDLVWPLIPAGALLAGRQVAELTRKVPARVFYSWLCLVIVVGNAGFACYTLVWRARTEAAQHNAALKRLAAEIERRGGKEFPLTHVNDPMTFQVYLDTFRPRISVERAMQLLKGPQAAWVAVTDPAPFYAARSPEFPRVYTLFRDEAPPGPWSTWILANRPTWGSAGPWAFCFGPILVRAQRMRLVLATEREFRFLATDATSEVVLTNEGSEPRSLRISLATHLGLNLYTPLLKPGRTWRMTADQLTASSRLHPVLPAQELAR